MIELYGIEKSYHDGRDYLNRVLRGVDMKVEAGEFVAIKGVSGSGKTTLLSILGTLLLPDSGRYVLGGTEVNASSDLARIRNERIGFVFQDHRLLPQYTVLENILLPILAKSSRCTYEELVYTRNLMEMARIGDLSGQYPATLSGGEASRVTMCRALVRKPLLLLADEPTGQLDHANARNMVSMLNRLNRKLGTTIVMVTHSDEASSAAHRVLTLDKGVLS